MTALTIEYLRRITGTLNDRLEPKGGWHGEGGMEVAQAVALAAAGVFAIIAIFAVFEGRAIELVNQLFDRMASG